MFSITTDEIYQILIGPSMEFPKYTTQIMNLANQNSQGTRSKIVGQMSDLVVECTYNTYDEWRKWYLSKYPTALNDATEKIWEMIKKLKKAINEIDEDMVNKWVEDLVINKSFTGIKFQDIILNKLSDMYNTTYRMAIPDEESKGIDGYIGTQPVQIKPVTYRDDIYGENEYPVVYYEKKRDKIIVYDEELNNIEN